VLLRFRAQIILYFGHVERSVLGGRPDVSLERLGSVKFALASAIVSAGFFLLTICGYVAALFVTSRLVRDALAGDELRLQHAINEVNRSCKHGIADLSVKAFAVGVASMALFALFVASMVRLKLRTVYGMTYALVVVLFVLVAYLITPWVIRSQSSSAIPQHVQSAARRIAMGGVVASSLIGLLVERMVASFGSELARASSPVNLLVMGVESLLSLAPYIPVAIALSLVAWGEGGEG
jgi:hypothetical protein